MSDEMYRSTTALDLRTLAQLKVGTQRQDKQAIKKAAQAFEAIIIQMLLHEMRQSIPDSTFISHQASNQWLSIYDQAIADQWSQSNHQKLGLSEQLLQQMSGTTDAVKPAQALLPPQQTVHPAPLQSRSAQAHATPPAAPIPTPTHHDTMTKNTVEKHNPHIRSFIHRVWWVAQKASRICHVAPEFLIAHAALESGWGVHELQTAQGQGTHNLFGIKSTPQWRGPTVMATTTEWKEGRPHRTLQKFRAYHNDDEAFMDYAHVIQAGQFTDIDHGSDAVAFVTHLQKNHYATDPRYAEKLSHMITYVGQITLQEKRVPTRYL